MSRRDKTSIGFSPLMVIAVLLALALAISFPFALVNTMPQQLSPLEQAKQVLEDAAPSYDGDAVDLNSLRVLETDPNGTTFLAGYTSDGGIAGVIYYDGGTVTGTVSKKDGDDVGFAGAGTDNTGYLYVKAAPQNKLGFHYCARSKVGVEPTSTLMEELAESCGDSFE